MTDWLRAQGMFQALSYQHSLQDIVIMFQNHALTLELWVFPIQYV